LIADARIADAQIHRPQKKVSRSRVYDAWLFQGRDYSQWARLIPMR
jgi:hypothetical protein